MAHFRIGQIRQYKRYDIDAYIVLLQAIYTRHELLFSQLSHSLRTADRRYFARHGEMLFLKSPHLDSAHSRAIAPGWRCDTNLNTSEKTRILLRAIELAGLTIGDDVEIEFNNDPTPLTAAHMEHLLAAL